MSVSFLESGDIWVLLDSSRPQEVTPFSVTIPGGSQSAPFSVPVLNDGILEGPHPVCNSVLQSPDSLVGNQVNLTLSDPGVTTLKPVDDGYLQDLDGDGRCLRTSTWGTST